MDIRGRHWSAIPKMEPQFVFGSKEARKYNLGEAVVMSIRLDAIEVVQTRSRFYLAYDSSNEVSFGVREHRKPQTIWSFCVLRLTYEMLASRMRNHMLVIIISFRRIPKESLAIFGAKSESARTSSKWRYLVSTVDRSDHAKCHNTVVQQLIVWMVFG